MITRIMDWLVDYQFLTVLVLVTLLILFWFYMQKPRFEKFRFKRLTTISAFILCGALWLILMFGSYGSTSDPKEIIISGNSLCFMDVHTSSYKASTSENIRMYIVNPNTGEKQFRNNIGSEGDILAEQNGLIFYDDYDSYFVLDPVTNKILKTYSWETLASLYPQTAPGISKIVFENGDNGPETMLLNVQSKNGNHFYIDPFSGRIADSVFYVAARKPKHFSNNTGAIKIKGDSTGTKQIMVFVAKKGTDASQLIISSDGNQVKDPEEKTFLFPRFLAAFHDEGVIVIQSYETTEKKNFILTGVSYNMKQLWQIKESQLQSGDDELMGCTKYKDNFIFNLGCHYYSINAKTGSVNWQSSL
jgi:hypothetical protein